MEKKSLYIIIAIAVISVFGLVFYNNLTGRGTQNPSLGDCIDSDRGDDPYSPGIVSFSVSKDEYKDECYAKGNDNIEKYLKERLCLEKMDTLLYTCETGCLENENGEGYCKEGEAVRN